MRDSYKLTKEECEMLGLDYETDPEVQKENDVLEELKSKVTEEEILSGILEEDIDYVLADLKTGVKTKEQKDLLIKMKIAKASKDFIDDNLIHFDEEQNNNDKPEILYF
jgi:hypothetical protein